MTGLRRTVGCVIALIAWGVCMYLVRQGEAGRPAMPRSETVGYVAVDSVPPDATVRVTNQANPGVFSLGRTPCTLRLAIAGSQPEAFTVTVEKPGFRSAQKQVTLSRGAREDVAVQLTATEQPVTAEPRRPSHPVTITAVGDILLGQVKDPFGAVADALRDADITFGNLECALTTSTAHTASKSDADIATGEQYVFKADPSWASALSLAGFDVLSIANNHAMDYQAAGMRDTIAALQAKSMKPVGAGDNRAAARARREMVVGNVRVGFLAVSTVVPPGFAAGVNTPGVAAQPPAEAQQWLRDTVASARKNVDLLCVSMHWGIERQTTPADHQRKLAAACIHAGASFVIGHHPHCLQPVEIVDGGLVAYSLGNFVGLGTNDLSNTSEIVTACFDGAKLQWYEVTPVKLSGHRPSMTGPTKRYPAQPPLPATESERR